MEKKNYWVRQMRASPAFFFTHLASLVCHGEMILFPFFFFVFLFPESTGCAGVGRGGPKDPMKEQQEEEKKVQRDL